MKNVNKIIKDVVFGLAVTAVGLWVPHTADACTGITLKSQDGATVLARTIEWGGSYLNSRYVVVPRRYVQQSYVPGGQKKRIGIYGGIRLCRNSRGVGGFCGRRAERGRTGCRFVFTSLTTVVMKRTMRDNVKCFVRFATGTLDVVSVQDGG